jgi:hypothetical protein
MASMRIPTWNEFCWFSPEISSNDGQANWDLEILEVLPSGHLFFNAGSPEI